MRKPLSCNAVVHEDTSLQTEQILVRNTQEIWRFFRKCGAVRHECVSATAKT